MKKIVFVFMALGLLASCSDDGPSGVGNPPGDSDVTLLKKTIETAPNGSEFISTYTYEGNKITAINHNDGTVENFAYQGSFLTEIRHYKNGGLIKKETFLYDNSGIFGAHVDYVYDLANPANNYAIRTNYSYDGNKVNFVQLKGDDSSQDEEIQTGSMTLASNGNIVKFEGSTGNKVVNYSFDFKKAPLREAFGYGFLLLSRFEGGFNNVTSSLVSINGQTANTLTNHTYNNKEYPVTATHTDTNSAVYSIQYFY